MKDQKRKVNGNIYAILNKRGFVNIVLDIESLGEIQVKLSDFGSENQKKANKKLAYRIYCEAK